MLRKSQSWRPPCLLENMYAIHGCLKNESSEDTTFQGQTIVGGDLAGWGLKGNREMISTASEAIFSPFKDP